jgi:hypothetical protein
MSGRSGVSQTSATVQKRWRWSVVVAHMECGWRLSLVEHGIEDVNDDRYNRQNNTEDKPNHGKFLLRCSNDEMSGESVR